jgi:hypothetical protein
MISRLEQPLENSLKDRRNKGKRERKEEIK